MGSVPSLCCHQIRQNCPFMSLNFLLLALAISKIPLIGTVPWVNILPKNPYLAKRVVLKNLNLLKSKNDDFWEHLPNG